MPRQHQRCYGRFNAATAASTLPQPLQHCRGCFNIAAATSMLPRHTKRVARPLPVIVIHPKPADGPPDPSWLSGWPSRPLPAIRESLPTPPDPPKGTPNPSRPSRPSRRASCPLPAFRICLPTTLGPPGRHPNPSWPSGKAFQPLPTLWEGITTPPSLLGGPSNPTQSSRSTSQPL